MIQTRISFSTAGTVDAILKMIRYEGLYGFYKGMGTKIVQSVFAASVLFMVKEELVKAFVFVSDKGKKIRSTTIGKWRIHCFAVQDL